MAFILALVLSLITIAFAWLFYRPLLAITFIFIALELLFFVKWERQSQSTQNINDEPEQPGFESQSVLKPQKLLASEIVIPQKDDLEATKF